MTKIGIVGLGKMGLLHAGILNALPSCSVTSITEKESMLTRFAKKLLPNLKFYTSLEDMLLKEHELDAIYVTTPISSHLPIIEKIATVRSDIGVFMEKPLAGNYYEAREISELSSKARIKGMVGFQKRFSPVFQKGKQFLESGVLGEPVSFSSYSYVSGVFNKGRGWRFKAGQGGALLDLGSHLIDILLWYFSDPISVEGSTESRYSKEVDDSARGTLKFKSGLIGSFDISWSIEGYRLPEIGVNIVGTKGKIWITDDSLKLELRQDSVQMRSGKYHFMKPEFDSAVDYLIGDPEYCIEDKHFTDCLSNQIMPQPDFWIGARVNHVIENLKICSEKSTNRET
ncbi:MAG: Gfo/Idh/MocA family protein [Nitrososphaerales archaeon]